MIDAFVFFYALLTFYVLSSIGRNRKEKRPDTPILALVGWGLASASFTLFTLLAGLACWIVLNGR